VLFAFHALFVLVRFDRLGKHFFRAFDRIIQTIAAAVVGVFLPHAAALFFVFDPVVDLGGEVFFRTRLEKRTFVERELRRRRFFGIGDDGHQPATERLDTGDRLDLDIRGVYIQIRKNE